MARQPPEWATQAHNVVEPGVTVRLNNDGTIDEIITAAPVRFHLEQMAAGQYWIGLDWVDDAGVEQYQSIILTRHKGSIYPTMNGWP